LGRAYNILDHPGSATWNGALLDDDGACFGVFCDRPRRTLHGANVGHGSGTQPLCLGRRVDTNEDDVGLGDRLDNIGGEDEVRLAGFELNRASKARQGHGGVEGAVSGDAHHFQQTILVDWEVGRIPRRHALLVQVNNVDEYLLVVVGDHGSSWAACLGHGQLMLGLET
jgi:hypothetical protein